LLKTQIGIGLGIIYGNDPWYNCNTQEIVRPHFSNIIVPIHVQVAITPWPILGIGITGFLRIHLKEYSKYGIGNGLLLSLIVGKLR
jgi:hypothetical protein